MIDHDGNDDNNDGDGFYLQRQVPWTSLPFELPSLVSFVYALPPGVIGCLMHFE